MNPLFAAAQAALALATECLDDRCAEYPRVVVETAAPVIDCATLAAVVGPARAYSGSCVGRLQMKGYVDIVLARCCDPMPKLSAAAGYTPPDADAITDAVACLTRDAWAVYNCVVCDACSTLGSIRGVTACCDQETGPPELLWSAPQGGCRSATIRIPLVFTACCEPTEG